MPISIGFVVMISATVTGNLLMKLGAKATPSPILLNLLSWKAFAGIAAFGFAGVIYAWILKYLPLNVANSLAAAQFVSVILASALVLAEPIPLQRWIGIALIVGGILVVGLTVKSTGASVKPPIAQSKEISSQPQERSGAALTTITDK